MAAVQKRKIQWAISLFLVMLYFSGLTAQAQYGGGTGEPNDPYQIATADGLIALGETSNDYDKHFILTADIDLDPNLPGGKGFDKAVIAPDVNDDEDRFQGTAFTGVFDGNGHTISHLTIEGSGLLGLFGQTISGASISNLGLEAVDVNGTSDYVGGLVGRNYGSITTSYSTGTVSGEGPVGGLVGYNGGNITMSYSTCAVTGDVAAGLVAVNGIGGWKGWITMCYSTGAVTAGSPVGEGGLVCFNIVGHITSCFWDMETSGHPRRMGMGGVLVTGLTTAEMQTASTFLEAGWDFVGETANGTEDIWSICEGTNYPRLAWQIPAGDFVCPDGITIEDFLFFIEHWRDDNCDISNDYCDGTDLDFSGTVDEADLEILVGNWLTGGNDE